MTPVLWKPPVLRLPLKKFLIPGTFDIQYMYRGSENNFINKVSTCFLTQVDVQYGDAKFKTYEEATGLRGKGLPPQKSQIQL